MEEYRNEEDLYRANCDEAKVRGIVEMRKPYQVPAVVKKQNLTAVAACIKFSGFNSCD